MTSKQDAYWTISNIMSSTLITKIRSNREVQNCQSLVLWKDQRNGQKTENFDETEWGKDIFYKLFKKKNHR